jgi:hypothetical protein
MENIFFLLIAFQVKQFTCDYVLQSKYMLNKTNTKGWAIPLAAHCIVHAITTGLISFVYSQNFILSLFLIIFDFSCHFIMDRIKSSPNILGKFTPENKLYWWSLGFDQMIHHLTHYSIIAILVFYPFT